MGKNLLTKIPFGLKGEAFRSPMPFSAFDPKGTLMADFQLHQLSIIVVLNSREECNFRAGLDLFKKYEEDSLQIIHCPITDFDVPDLPILVELVHQIKQYLDQGEKLNIHCFAGIGRTGLVLACLAKLVFNFGPEQALNWVRQFVPEAVQTETQWQMVREFKL